MEDITTRLLSLAGDLGSSGQNLVKLAKFANDIGLQDVAAAILEAGYVAFDMASHRRSVLAEG